MKKTVNISGNIIYPLKEGKRAVIAYRGDFLYTSRVVEIIELSEDLAHFETMNSIYRVALSPVPVTASMAMQYAEAA